MLSIMKHSSDNVPYHEHSNESPTEAWVDSSGQYEVSPEESADVNTLAMSDSKACFRSICYSGGMVYVF